LGLSFVMETLVRLKLKESSYDKKNFDTLKVGGTVYFTKKAQTWRAEHAFEMCNVDGEILPDGVESFYKKGSRVASDIVAFYYTSDSNGQLVVQRVGLGLTTAAIYETLDENN